MIIQSLMTTLAAAPMKLPSWDKFFFGITLDIWLRYVIFAGLGWLLGYVLFKRQWQHRKINPKLPTSSDMWREIRWSMLTVLIYALVGIITIHFIRLGLTRMYRNIYDYGWAWFVLSIFVSIVIHDTWFYWSHRLMHHRALFRWVHKIHHLSNNPSPWAAYAFAPTEAFMQALIFPLVVFTIPIHPFAFALFMLWQIAFNVAGHTGYEFHPPWLMDSWLGKFLNTPTNHAMHHESMRGNYGLYFNVWDRLMGTNHANYETRFREVTAQKKTVLN